MNNRDTRLRKSALIVGLEWERFHPLLIDDVNRGLADIVAGRMLGADAAIAELQQRRAAGARKGPPSRKRG